MKSRTFLIGLVLIASIGLGGWFGWRWYTSPEPPHIPLDGLKPELRAAITQAVQKVRDHPRSGKSWGDLSRLLLANGFIEQSLPCLAQAQRFDPNEPTWHYLQGSGALLLSIPREGLPPLRKALALAHLPEQQSAICFLLVQALLEEVGQVDEAAQHVQTLRDLEGDTPRVRLVMGLLAQAQGEFAAAREHLSTLTDHPSARRQVASLLATLNRDNEKLAASYRERVALLPPDLPWPNSFDDEVRDCRVQTTDPQERYNELWSAGRRKEAVDVLRKIVADSPNEYSCFILGFNLVNMKEYEEGEQALRKALALNHRNMKAHLFLGVALLEKAEKRLREPGGREQALDWFRQAVQAEDTALSLQGDVGLAHLIRGRALKSLSRTREAIAALRQATLIGPDLSEAHLSLGEALAEEGDLTEALKHLENAVRVAPAQDPRPRQALEKWRTRAKMSP